MADVSRVLELSHDGNDVRRVAERGKSLANQLTESRRVSNRTRRQWRDARRVVFENASGGRRAVKHRALERKNVNEIVRLSWKYQHEFGAKERKD